MTDRTLDPSRYRVARTIIDRWEAGEAAADIAYDYALGHNALGHDSHAVELIVAAYKSGIGGGRDFADRAVIADLEREIVALNRAYDTHVLVANARIDSLEKELGMHASDREGKYEVPRDPFNPRAENRQVGKYEDG